MTLANLGVHLYFKNMNPGATQARRGWAHVGFTIFAWFSGKVAYRDICITKIAMSNSNSPLAQKFRQRKGMNLIYGENYVPPNEDPLYQELPADPVDPWGSSFSSASQDPDDRRQQSSTGFLDPNPANQEVTYDTLRERNRRSYQEPIRRQF